MVSGNNLSVLHIVGSSKFGGGTMVVFSLARMAQEHGLKPAMLTDDPETMEACRARDIEVVEFHGLIREIRPWTDISAVRRLSRLLKQRSDTIVHTHTLKGGLVGRAAAYKAKVPIIIHHSHGFSFQDDAPLWRKKMITVAERQASRWCDRIISVNQADIELAAKWKIGPLEKYIYVPNGINPKEIDSVQSMDKSALLKMIGAEADSFLMVVVARLFSEKGHPWLFEALKIICDKASRPVHLLLLGDGPHRDIYLKQIKELGIDDCVHLMGYRTDCVAIEKACDLFVLPSLREGHSITILEAMAIGIPIVATDIRGINDSVGNEQEALLVRPRDSNALAQAILRILNNSAMAARLKANAKDRFLREFTEEKTHQRVWQVYKDVARIKGVQGLPD